MREQSKLLDYDVAKVVNVFHNAKVIWERDNPKPRQYDAALIFLDGSINYFFPDREVLVSAGDIFLLPENIPYAGKRLSGSVEFVCVDFQSGGGSLLWEAGLPVVIHARDSEYFRQKFMTMLEIYEKQRADAQLRMKSLLYGILAAILRNGYTTGAKTETDDILDFIASNASDPGLGLPVLCERFRISESQLRRDVKKATGLPPSEYIRGLRVNRAKNELINTRRRISEIAEACGFSSQYYFSKCFSDQCGVTPTAFRDEHSLY